MVRKKRNSEKLLKLIFCFWDLMVVGTTVVTMQGLNQNPHSARVGIPGSVSSPAAAFVKLIERLSTYNSEMISQMDQRYACD